jgi:hypothetical protein
MRDRRSEKRFRFGQLTSGALRLFLDVIAHRNGDDEWIAISREPATIGETLTLELVEDEMQNRINLCVVESRPVIFEGDMRHRIRLHTVLYDQQIRRS